MSDSHRMTVPSFLLSGSGDHYILRVVGNNLNSELIAEGDFVIIRKSNTANDKDLFLTENYLSDSPKHTARVTMSLKMKLTTF